jgi:hypothetical protein
MDDHDQASRLFKRLKDAAADVPHLIALLNDGDAGIRRAAVETLDLPSLSWTGS